MKKNKGITLIALVITIVVLIILAGVAINLSLGENGIFNKAKYASESQLNAQKLENDILEGYTNTMDMALINTRNSEDEFKYIGEELTFVYKDDGPIIDGYSYKYYVEADISSNVQDYKNKTIDDMIIQITSYGSYKNGQNINSVFNYEYSYDSENGIIKIDAMGGWMYYVRPIKFKLYIK